MQLQTACAWTSSIRVPSGGSSRTRCGAPRTAISCCTPHEPSMASIGATASTESRAFERPGRASYLASPWSLPRRARPSSRRLRAARNPLACRGGGRVRHLAEPGHSLGRTVRDTSMSARIAASVSPGRRRHPGSTPTRTSPVIPVRAGPLFSSILDTEPPRGCRAWHHDVLTSAVLVFRRNVTNELVGSQAASNRSM